MTIPCSGLDLIRSTPWTLPLPTDQPCAPDLESLVGDQVADWLRSAYGERAVSPRFFVRFAAVGLVARLWCATGPSASRETFDRALRGATLPADRAREWGVANASLLATQVPIAIMEADYLIDELLRGDVGATLRDIVRRRDDLESFASLLRMTGQAGLIDALLAEVDQAAKDNAFVATAMRLCEDGQYRASRHYCAVFTDEPMAWWGLLAAPL